MFLEAFSLRLSFSGVTLHAGHHLGDDLEDRAAADHEEEEGQEHGAGGRKGLASGQKRIGVKIFVFPTPNQ